MGGGTLISHPLPLVQPQDEFYDQASPDKRTEADGNSDPNSGESPSLLWLLSVALVILFHPCELCNGRDIFKCTRDMILAHNGW